MKTLVVIPTYNERETLTSLVSRLFSSESSANHDILVIDDASPDGTGALADSLAAEHSQLHVLHRPQKLGIGSAYFAGFRYALDHGYDAVCEMDADGSHDPADLANLTNVVAVGEADVAVGSRRVSGGKILGWGWHRHAMSVSAAIFARTALGCATRDVTSGFRCYRTVVAKALLAQGISSDGYAFQEETIFHCERLGWRIAELPVTFRDRTVGASKLSWKEVPPFFAAVFRLLRRYGRIPPNARRVQE